MTTTTETRPRLGFSARLRAELDELRAADAELKARRQEAWEQYCARVDQILDELKEELD